MTKPKMCGITDAHLGHEFTEPHLAGRPGHQPPDATRSCPGVPHRPFDDVPPGPCFDAGPLLAGGTPVHCSLLAGHAGSHTATDGSGNTTTWHRPKYTTEAASERRFFEEPK